MKAIQVLLIEDNPADARFIRELLVGKGFELSIAEDLHQGIDDLQQHSYDVILLDLSLPDSMGLETIIRVQEAKPGTAIVVLTGFDDETLGLQAVQSGAQDYLAKGDVDAKLLKRAIYYAIERQHMNAQIYRQSRELVAAEERQRLARDLHDSVSQTLFTCQTLAEASLRKWEKDPPRAYELLNEVHGLTAAALSEMRVLLLELRSEVLTKISLKELFEQYLQPIPKRGNFELIMHIDNIAVLPPDVQITAYRIAQEALNNINKHAEATQVNITVKSIDDGFCLSIQDNGRGFLAEDVQPTSLGMNIMRERAEAINADLSITSNPGVGTEVRLTWHQQI